MEVEKLANIKSSKKRIKTSRNRASINLARRSALKTYIKKAKVSVANGDENANESVKLAIKKIDQAAAKGLIHKNNAARKRSKLARSLNAMSS